MNILFINSIKIYGGGEVWMINAMKELRDRNHNVTLVCNPDAQISYYAEQNNFALNKLKMSGDFDPFTIVKLVRILRENKIDIILTNMDKELRLSGIAARLTDVKAVICRKGIDYPLKNNPRYRFTYNRLATHIVANSEATKYTMLKNAPWLDQSKISVIYNGINPDLYTQENTNNLRRELGIPDESALIGFVGRLNIQKGITYILQAFERLVETIPKAHLLMVGTGDLKNKIESVAKEKKFINNIHLAGFRDDIPDVMRTIDFLILPSVWEGFGTVLIEAMASEKPCITTKISSMPEIVEDDRTGLVIPPKNADELYKAMRSLIQNPLKAKDMGREGRKVVLNRFTLCKMADQYEQLFHKYFNS